MHWELRAVSAREDPPLFGALRQISALRARREYVIDTRARTSARSLFLRTLSPFVGPFLKRENNAGFAALALDPALPDIALVAYAAHLGGNVTIAETERLFILYGEIGPTMWRAIEAEQRWNEPGLFASFR